MEGFQLRAQDHIQVFPKIPFVDQIQGQSKGL